MSATNEYNKYSDATRVKDVPDILPRRSFSPILFTSTSSSTADNEFDNLFVQQQQQQQMKKTNKSKNNRSIFKSVKADRILRTAKRTIYTAGRPPWYDTQGQSKESFLIGICGGSASGKTTVAKRIIEALDVPWVTLLSMDSFYKVLNDEQQELARKNEYNFDHPDAFDFDLLIETLRKLKDGKRVDVPIYNFVTHRREKITKTMYGASVIICEGIMIFAKKELVDMMEMKVFIETDSDIRLARRLQRDITERGRDLEGVLKQYNQFVKPMFDFYIQPSMVHADIIVPRGGENRVAIDLIVQHVHTQLQSKGLKLRSKLLRNQQNQPLPETLKALPPTPQIKGMHTIIRDKDTTRDEFVFYSKRLMRLLIEFAMSFFPFKTIEVDTPQGVKYCGKTMNCDQICGVSILRAGETMEQALCDVLKSVRIGKILIQTNQLTQEPELYYLRLPDDIRDYKVILMDATVASGAASMMAIRVLLDHDVLEENIMLCSLLMASSGVQTIAYAFPKVLMVTTEVDPEVNDKFYIRPGIGNYGDRYYGTESYE
ncbi:uridine-cytidine kinase-like 1 [Dermatophagoides farinae]|uniref:Uridine kinase n=1 Tax=Dermatophagoides farinae TaxID=6954 RepID=A0A9D4P3N7_DERFA|nr:uridine-cytidine kinase-like 1 [Dermatophagoides farinae]KAH7643099.1 uridine-cytidine kinase-like protein [Dermatophagoides farinae]